MMAVIIKFIPASRALEYKYELERSGLICDKDFTWAMSGAAWPGKTHVEFNFVDPAMETFYKLKWT